ncbi:hypothetical protein GCM10011487_54920 [Steroidobacter agaridevorans]|uniref:DUF3592 domain-containing protein n=1 Tax=Steroidobacter agaridevorans TaxID=2695856 RepID=A0A829YL12_9GAMM|nr:DUF3592 domain-containing protein [Steroidobacter agaridevorans]GFE83492.1 hypothetical protein GCM10011487_54920 [Steroidobacter agaridevorans]
METLGLIIAVLLGFAFVAMFGSGFVESLRSRNWTRVRGRITAAGVSERTCTDRPSSFFPAVCYEYPFEGRLLSGERIGFFDIGARHPNVAKKVLARYPVGAEVDVYVDPLRPTRSVLTPGVSWAGLFAAACGLGLAVLVVILLAGG